MPSLAPISTNLALGKAFPKARSSFGPASRASNRRWRRACNLRRAVGAPGRRCTRPATLLTALFYVVGDQLLRHVTARLDATPTGSAPPETSDELHLTAARARGRWLSLVPHARSRPRC